MESKKINQLATELAPELSDLTIIGDPTTGISKKITLSQMASLFTGTVEEYANLASFPLVGTADTIYIALDTNIIYRWNTGTSAYVELSPNIVTSLVFNDANGFDGTISLVGSTATLTITTALTQGSVPFIGASGALSQDNANLFFDDTNNRLGVNTNVPTTALDVFGSGIIGRLNGTSTNNAFLGFASAGTNKWSIGNVQSDHRFRIYNEATTSELVSVLQTGEVGIGIANPLTKLHIFGGASALIANLDANTSVAKSISFRSGNSSRINLEVSGTESGSNAGADLFIRRYSDAGALIDTPLTITRSTGTLTYSGIINISNATASSSTTTGALIITGGIGISGALYGITGVFNGLVNTTAGNGISAGGNSFAIAPSSTRGVININGSTDQFLTLGSNGYLSGSSTLVRLLSTPDLDFAVGGSQRLLIAASGGKATFSNALAVKAGFAGDKFLFTGAGSGDALGVLYDNAGAAKIQLYTNGDSYFTGGKVGIGTTAPQAGLEIVTDSGSVNALRVVSNRAFNANTDVGITFRYMIDSTNYTSGGLIVAAKDNNTSGNQNGNMQFYTNGGSGIVERLRITSVGYTLIGVSSNSGFGSVHRISTSTAQGNYILSIDGGAGQDFSTLFMSVSGSTGSGQAAAQWVGRNTSTGRSINAGGTINASGADYAEYMLKAIEDNIAKGDIVGVNAEGKLTNIFEDSISFVVKSTDPSYVGGDSWGNSDAIGKMPMKQDDQTEEEFEKLKVEYEIKLEAARATVDRIAFSGQVPCNVLNAKVGDYIIPIKQSNGKISGQAVANPTFEQYRISVGKVWKIMEDGRAWIAVKIG